LLISELNVGYANGFVRLRDEFAAPCVIETTAENGVTQLQLVAGPANTSQAAKIIRYLAVKTLRDRHRRTRLSLQTHTRCWIYRLAPRWQLRSVTDSGWLSVDSVTALIGVNGSAELAAAPRLADLAEYSLQTPQRIGVARSYDGS
jgi:hypothetical protein